MTDGAVVSYVHLCDITFSGRYHGRMMPTSVGSAVDECRGPGPRVREGSRPIDFDRLLKLRLVVARVGEIDAARWWNTTSMLGQRGATVLERGLPATHYFAQARVVFAVAQARCDEVFSPPAGGITLWHLPAEVEDQFDKHWHTWLDEMNDWRPFFEMLASAEETDLDNLLVQVELISPPQIDAADRLRRSADGRAVLVPNRPDLDDDLITLLAAAFARGEPGRLAVPYTMLGQS